ncbi:MAG TPA: hypothetical protein VIK74_07340 [Parasegetibacter sp.]|jgi:hypothetical protein
MKLYSLKILMIVLVLGSLAGSCSRKTGCPSNGKNVGAERILNNEKLPKAKKFKA